MHNQLFEAALGVTSPWFVQAVDFDAAGKTLTILVDFVAGSRFPHPQAAGLHPVHDTQIKRYRHLNFFQNECRLEVRTPRVKLPDGRVVPVEPDWAGKLTAFTARFETLVRALAQQTPLAGRCECRSSSPASPSSPAPEIQESRISTPVRQMEAGET